ncbi:hypothetical protein OG422_02700 [Streptomyces sp. NBC_01525]|uniref:hypothetical protein n=1 Tax=Streptomyces sp. NBC_01525 TaxID=2903893 RepID=UPI00386A5E7D
MNLATGTVVALEMLARPECGDVLAAARHSPGLHAELATLAVRAADRQEVLLPLHLNVCHDGRGGAGADRAVQGRARRGPQAVGDHPGHRRAVLRRTASGAGRGGGAAAGGGVPRLRRPPTGHGQAAATLAPLKKAPKALTGASWVVGRPDSEATETRRGRPAPVPGG